MIDRAKVCYNGLSDQGMASSANGLIAEAEQLVLRSDSDTMGMTGKLTVGASVEKMERPHAIYRETIPEAERLSREELIRECPTRYRIFDSSH